MNIGDKVVEATIMQLQHLVENKSNIFVGIVDKLKSLNISEQNAEAFTNYLYSRYNRFGGGILMPKDVRNKCKENNILIPNRNYLSKSDILYLDDKALQLWYETEYLGIINNTNDTNKRKKVDLRQYLIQARNIVTTVMGKEYVDKYDSYPDIDWSSELGDITLGRCQTYSSGKPKILINKAITIREEFIDDYLLNVVIHEFIHSLKSCIKDGHDGEWLRVANLVSADTEYTISKYAQEQEGKAFEIALKKLKN